MMKQTTLRILGVLALLVVLGCESVEFRSARMYVNEGNLDKAEEFFLLALKAEPENALVPYLYAKDVLIAKKKWEEMNDMFNLALEINPDAKLPQFYLVDDELIRTVSQAIAIKREQEWSKIFNAGVEMLDAGSVEEAENHFLLASKVLPDDGKAYKALYSLYFSNGQPEKAKDILKSAPDDRDIFILRGDLEKMAKNFQAAEDLYVRAIELTEDNDELDELYLRMFEIKFNLNDFESALKWGEKIKNYTADVAFNMGALKNSMAISRYNDAIEIYNEIVVTDNPGSALVQSAVDKFEEAKGLFEQARIHFLDAFAMNPEDQESRSQSKDIRKRVKMIDDTFLPELAKF